MIAFWQAQDFDLALPSVDGRTPLGNCDLCFLKSRQTIQAILRGTPHLADWWVEQEATKAGKTRNPSVAMSRKDRPNYATMLQAVRDEKDRDCGEEDALTACACHD